jgi:hypothetical protein
MSLTGYISWGKGNVMSSLVKSSNDFLGKSNGMSSLVKSSNDFLGKGNVMSSLVKSSNDHTRLKVIQLYVTQIL